MKILILSLIFSFSAWPKTLKIAPTTKVGFGIYKYKISDTVSGRFEKVSGSADITKGKLSQVNAQIEMSSIQTEHEKRDNHLKSPDFFNVEKYPHMTFMQTETVKISGEFDLKGELTIKDKTLPVVLKVKNNGNNKFSASTKIDRYKFGVTWNKRMDEKDESLIDTIKNATKGLIDKYVISNEIDVKLEIELK